jgi:hypothetical protein
MLSSTESGVVLAVKGEHLTILLKAGNKLQVHVKKTKLKLGEKCSVAFDNTTGKPIEIYGADDHTIAGIPDKPEEESTTNAELNLLGETEPECSREPEGCEVWSEEFEVLELECSRETED